MFGQVMVIFIVIVKWGCVTFVTSLDLVVFVAHVLCRICKGTRSLSQRNNILFSGVRNQRRILEKEGQGCPCSLLISSSSPRFVFCEVDDHSIWQGPGKGKVNTVLNTTRPLRGVYSQDCKSRESPCPAECTCSTESTNCQTMWIPSQVYFSFWLRIPATSC